GWGSEICNRSIYRLITCNTHSARLSTRASFSVKWPLHRVDRRMIETAKMPGLPVWKQIVFGFFMIVIIVGLPIILILGVEGVGRAIIHLKYGVAGKSYGLWQYDRELGAIHAANAYNHNSETNNFGFRNKENVVEPKPANALRIIAYGGSTTFCYNLSTD